MSQTTTSVEDIVRQRGITEVLHFTTNPGLLGIIATRSIKSRDLLEESEYLEFIFTGNVKRKDLRWTDHVNLSITRVNPSFFGYSRRLHFADELWWCILSLEPVIMSHDGVWFGTTNNIWSGCRRAQGPDGLNALFEPTVERYPAIGPARRTAQHRPSWTTCDNAEVLYPRELSTDFVQRIYFANPENLATAQAQVETLGHDSVELELRPEMFTE